jgi:hypothetical protein
MKCTNQQEVYNCLIQPLNHKDPDGYIKKCFDILKGGNQSSFHPFDFIYSSVFGAAEEDDDFPIIAAIATARQHLNWNSHVKTLIWEGQFKRMYQMSLSHQQLIVMVSHPPY